MLSKKVAGFIFKGEDNKSDLINTYEEWIFGFINEFMKHKSQAILNAIKYSLKTAAGVYVAYEKRKIIARYFINNKKSNKLVVLL